MMEVILIGDMKFEGSEPAGTGLVIEADPMTLRSLAGFLYGKVDLLHAGALRNAVDAFCSCGGDGPGSGCQACEVWHRVKPFMVEGQ
jgi:hypothetical protein